VVLLGFVELYAELVVLPRCCLGIHSLSPHSAGAWTGVGRWQWCVPPPHDGPWSTRL